MVDVGMEVPREETQQKLSKGRIESSVGCVHADLTGIQEAVCSVCV